MPQRYLAMLEPLFRRFAPGYEVLAYGSRVTGGAHSGSDLDIVIRHPRRPDEECAALPALRKAVRQSDIPLLVEVRDWTRIPEDFRDEIRRNHIVLFASVAP